MPPVDRPIRCSDQLSSQPLLVCPIAVLSKQPSERDTVPHHLIRPFFCHFIGCSPRVCCIYFEKSTHTWPCSRPLPPAARTVPQLKHSRIIFYSISSIPTFESQIKRYSTVCPTVLHLCPRICRYAPVRTVTARIPVTTRTVAEYIPCHNVSHTAIHVLCVLYTLVILYAICDDIVIQSALLMALLMYIKSVVSFFFFFLVFLFLFFPFSFALLVVTCLHLHASISPTQLNSD